MRGLRKVWIKGERSVVSAVDPRGRTIIRYGKNGGPVIAQDVELRLVPKEARS